MGARAMVTVKRAFAVFLRHSLKYVVTLDINFHLLFFGLKDLCKKEIISLLSVSFLWLLYNTVNTYFIVDFFFF